MLGKGDDPANREVNQPCSRGLMYRSIEYLYAKMMKSTSADLDFYTNASYIEIYNEQVIDLLNDKKFTKKLQFRYNEEDVGRGVIDRDFTLTIWK